MSDKPKLSYEELMDQLKDPTILHAAAAKHGMKMVGMKEEKKEEKKLEVPKMEIPEDADLPTMIKGLNKFMGEFSTYTATRLNETQSNVERRVVESKQEEAARKVQEFARGKKDFEKLIPFIEPFYNTGKYSIEEAYELGKRASGQKEEKGDTSKKEESTPPCMTKTSENVEETGKPAKPISVRDSAKKNLEILLKDIKPDEDVLNESDEVET